MTAANGDHGRLSAPLLAYRIAYLFAIGKDYLSIIQSIESALSEDHPGVQLILIARQPEGTWNKYGDGEVKDFNSGRIERLSSSCADSAKELVAPLGDPPSGIIVFKKVVGAFSAGELERLKAIASLIAPLMERRYLNEAELIALRKERAAMRENDEILRTIFSTTKDLVYIASAEDRIASINEAGLKMLGVEDKFDVIGASISLWQEMPEERAKVVDRLMKSGYVADYETILKSKGGELLFGSESIHLLKDRGGEIKALIGIVKDISVKVQSEREILKMNIELADMNQELQKTRMLFLQQEKLASIGQLSAGIAHEINNPLGFIKSNHEVLKKFLEAGIRAWTKARDLDEASHDAIAEEEDLAYAYRESESLLKETEDGYRRIIEIVNSLKNFARDDAAERFSRYDIEKGIESTLVIAQNEVKYVAEVEVSYGGVSAIDANGGEINQVLLNTMINAAQAIKSSGKQGLGKIKITTAERKDVVVCLIDDDGPGIPEGKRLKIFDPFFTTKPIGSGTGLGLAISYDIVVNKHNGSLMVYDSPLGGARFEIALPKARA